MGQQREPQSEAEIDDKKFAECNPFHGKREAPNGLLARLHYYGRKHGYFYAVLSFVGRKSSWFWSAVAPLFARGKIAAWLAKPGPHIVNLGGGSNTFDRWLTADIDARADVFVNVTKKLPFPDATVDIIYLEEVIEHVSRNEGELLLTESFRILKPGGKIRLTTPCLDSYCKEFDGTIAQEEKVNAIFYLHEHRHIYSRSGIRRLLEESGFNSITESDFRDSASSIGYFDTHALRFAISDSGTTQYWDAEKRNAAG